MDPIFEWVAKIMDEAFAWYACAAFGHEEAVNEIPGTWTLMFSTAIGF